MSDVKTCPVCNVAITQEDQVIFSSGSPGTRARLYARVCQYTENKGCINQDPQLVGELTQADKFEEGKDLVLPVSDS